MGTAGSLFRRRTDLRLGARALPAFDFRRFSEERKRLRISSRALAMHRRLLRGWIPLIPWLTLGGFSPRPGLSEFSMLTHALAS